MAFYRKLLKRFGKGPLNTAVIVAAGSSSRMGQDKLTIPLAGKTVMERTLQAFEDCELVHEIIIVAGKMKRRSVTTSRDMEKTLIPSRYSTTSNSPSSTVRRKWMVSTNSRNI